MGIIQFYIFLKDGHALRQVLQQMEKDFQRQQD